MGNLADYIIRASFMQERMVYRRDAHQVEFRAHNGNEERFFDTLEWLSARCSNVPNEGESRRWRECAIMCITALFCVLSPFAFVSIIRV